MEWRGEKYTIGSSVFLHPDSIKFKSYAPEQERVKSKQEVN